MKKIFLFLIISILFISNLNADGYYNTGYLIHRSDSAAGWNCEPTRDSTINYNNTLFTVYSFTGNTKYAPGCTDDKRYEYYVEEYAMCPNGTVFDTESKACITPPPCDGTWDSDTDTCIPPPPDDLDDDNDGIPNKCDPSYEDYSTMDCDGDGLTNSFDSDIDGDGILNQDDNTPYGPGSELYGNKACQGPVTSPLNAWGVEYKFHEYRLDGSSTKDYCFGLLKNNVNIDGVLFQRDKNLLCETDYCFIHELQSDCTFDSSWYRPNKNWDYVPNVSETQCNLLVDGIKYSTNSFVTPDVLKCSDVGLCYVKRIDPEEDALPTETNSEDNDPTMEAPDLNSTTSDLAPLLNAQNTTNKHLQDLKDKTDHSNKRLDDLKDLSSKALDVNKDIKSGIDGLKSNSDRSLQNQSVGLSKLASINSAIDGASDKIGTMSDTITGNQVLGNGFLNSIDGKMSTNNNLLTDIKDSLSGDGSVPDTSANDGFSDLLTGDSDFLDFVTSEFSTFKDNINSNFADVETQYNNAKSLFENPLSSPSYSGSYSSSCFSFSLYGKQVVLDMSFLSAISPIVYFIMTLTFMILNFRFLLSHLLRGDN